MKACLCFCFLTLISIMQCLNMKREFDGTNSMDQNKNTEKERKMDFASNFPTKITANEAKDTKYKNDEYSANYKKLSATEKVVSMNVTQQRDPIIIGKPDLSDVCFRVYNECIVVNAQPYERRSNMQLDECKQRCMQSQNDAYSCRSLVYDITNKVCDFFTHQGDQPPSKLLKYYEHSYLEPTFVNGCDLKYAKRMKTRETDSTDKTINNAMLLNDLTKEDRNQESCEEGKVVKYLRTQGFKFDSDNRINLKAYNLDRCIDACTNNIDDKRRPFRCRSFDYDENGCNLIGEVATRRGSRQLKQNSISNYYEKICIDDDLMSSDCQSINRFPQMILIGFAEAVITTQTFMGCFENCLKSRQLFAMNCTSAVYFYEELEQNCILNSENRQTQKNLFVEENADIVDYFEINCPLRKQKKIIDDLIFKS
ncbi:unnamed protein product [Cercopithifilaria johnstoni]|uniref:Apple domain-containing protein n=1 Tax=Cercopithifilaria johnstoni TaxID=2874296 RepID=A0A8J2MVD2_9BILA|nr:unnamed protein product [Cercopithifilaria johnstoni]